VEEGGFGKKIIWASGEQASCRNIGDEEEEEMYYLEKINKEIFVEEGFSKKNYLGHRGASQLCVSSRKKKKLSCE
jgi:hypothetical protein